MKDRRGIANELAEIEIGLKELEHLYEKFFSGSARIEPSQERTELGRRLRQFANRRIMQTDLRFKYQNLATRYHTYCGGWDRILRLIDEGRYIRQQHSLREAPTLPKANLAQTAAAGEEEPDEVELVLQQLQQAYRTCKMDKEVPNRQQVSSLLERQKEKIRERFGDRPVEFHVCTDEGKPKIKIRAKTK